MSSQYPVQIAQRAETGEVRYFPVDSAATFVTGALVYFDTSTQTLKECGADPSLIAGVALAPASVGLDTKGSLFGGTSIPVHILKPNSVLFMASSTTPLISHVGVQYGIEKTTNWRVDTTDTTNKRVTVGAISISPLQEGFYVTMVAANCQFAGIVS